MSIRPKRWFPRPPFHGGSALYLLQRVGTVAERHNGSGTGAPWPPLRHLGPDPAHDRLQAPTWGPAAPTLLRVVGVMPTLRLLFLALVLLVAAGTLVSLTWADARHAERLAKGIRIGGLEVGGLTREQAAARVWDRFRSRAMRSVRVRAGRRIYVLSARRAGVRWRIPSAVDRAYEHSRAGSVLERGWRALTGTRVEREFGLEPTVSTQAVRRFVDRVAEGSARPAVGARLDIGVSAVRVTKERTGRRLAAPERLRRRIAGAFVSTTSPRQFSAPVRRVEPTTTRASLLDRTPMVVTVSRSDRRARLFERGRLVRSYRVAVGEPEYPTPTGRFEVQTMQRDPVWNVPDSAWAGELAGKTIPAGDPRNALVARWIGFDGAVGFHGTKSLESLGRAASRGCVRMSRDDVISLYGRVRVGTPVLVGS